MKLSHSKLTTILTCPASYYLSYIQHISKKDEKSALAVGSAVHWGIEHNTENLTEYWNQQFKTRDQYGRDQLLAEAMVHGYMKHKDELLDKILTNRDGSKLQLLDETHELTIKTKLKTEKFEHEFLGIIDLLLTTDKGFVLVDYKTSTYTPDCDKYLDQIYRYIMLLRNEFPDIPICKIGIINIKKTGIRIKKNETVEQFLNRMKFEYDINDENYVNYHEFLPEDLDNMLIDRYIENLKKECDMAQMIADGDTFFINFQAAQNQYGKSDFWDIFYHTPDAYLLYKISDKIYDEETKTYLKSRDCVPIDMEVLNTQVINKYDTYKNLLEDFLESHSTSELSLDIFDAFHNMLRDNVLVDETLLNDYENTYLHELTEFNSEKKS